MTTPKALAGGCHIRDEQTKQILYQPVILEITMTSTRKKEMMQFVIALTINET